MRLINTVTGEFEEFTDLEKIPPYAILSHTWDKDGEQSYQDFVKIQEKYRALSPEEDIPPNSRSDDPRTVPNVQVTPSETPLMSHSPLPMYPRSRNSYSIFLGMLPLCWSLVFSIVHVCFSRMPGPSTPSPSELEPQDDPHVLPTLPPARRSMWDPDSGLSEKVLRACEIARRDGYGYIWIDSCCIDKTSSSELSEAINSMFSWYRAAQVCYAFLADVPSIGNVRGKRSSFRESRWFKRGWTLQELIAPLLVVFLSRDWDCLGTKDELGDIIQEITSIDRMILTHEKALNDESIANRMGWASDRRTTRVEDEAYSLLGIFGITMPTLYGEGGYAFRRLQEEILRWIPDQSLFVWGSWAWGYEHKSLPFKMPNIVKVDLTEPRTLFAPSPRHFNGSSPSRRRNPKTIRAMGNAIESLGLPVEEYIQTPYGIRTKLCLLPLQAMNPELHIMGGNSDTVSWYLIILRVQHADDPHRLLSRLCYLRHDEDNVEFLQVPNRIGSRPEDGGGQQHIGDHDTIIFSLLLDDLNHVWKSQLHTRIVYLSHYQPSIAKRQLQVDTRRGRRMPELELTLPTWTRTALQKCGYTVSESKVKGPTKHDPNSFSLTLFHASFNIYIEYRCIIPTGTFPSGGVAIAITARVWITSPGDEALCPNADVQSSPPYTFATWADIAPWTMTLPVRSLNLITDSGDQLTLRLGLDLTAPSRYNIRVHVTQTSPTAQVKSLRPDLEDVPSVLGEYHGTLNLVLSGSVRRSLEMKGYSVHFDLGPSVQGFHSHSLTLSTDSSGTDSGYVVINYLHTLRDNHHSYSDKLVVVARVTVVSSISKDGAETVQDGPHVVIWKDRGPPWKWSLEENHVVLTTLSGELFTLHLGLDLAWKSEFYLHVDIEPSTTYPQSPELLYPPVYSHNQEHPLDTLEWAHQNIRLTLPAHVKRDLRVQGYQILFERIGEGVKPANEYSASHLLTLSHIHSGVTIVIEYSYRLITQYPNSNPPYWRFMRRYPFALADPQPDSILLVPPANFYSDLYGERQCRQMLTFKVSVQVFSSESRNILGDTQSRIRNQGDPTTATVDWDATTGLKSRREERRYEALPRWRRRLPSKDITLTLPTGHQLTLSLGFYLVWYSEYCLIIGINPPIPFSHIDSRSEGPPVHDYDLDEASNCIEHAQKNTEPGKPTEAHDGLFQLAGPSMLDTPEDSRTWSRVGSGGRGGDDPNSCPEIEEPVALDART